ncbi:phasin [Breoghania corrubedonensis]|uniref:Phasin n=1 Tax=Breoghania corrubedonensis TaxID=665038 RepID=A0A2T5VF67_9HYPH|nr:phasin [Breoghania corrubedonensis]PTW62401.1 phasin [Breoghania corrubedonensis]
MTTPKSDFEIPEQMREFAEKSVDQARKAFDTFMDATQKAVGRVEEQTNAAQSGSLGMNKKALDYAEEHVDAAFQLAQKIVRANDVQEIFQLQSDYLKAQMEALGEQARDLSESAARTAGDVGRKGTDS